jgi:hypothetical protein
MGQRRLWFGREEGKGGGRREEGEDRGGEEIKTKCFLIYPSNLFPFHNKKTEGYY